MLALVTLYYRTPYQNILSWLNNFICFECVITTQQATQSDIEFFSEELPLETGNQTYSFNTV